MSGIDDYARIFLSGEINPFCESCQNMIYRRLNEINIVGN